MTQEKAHKVIISIGSNYLPHDNMEYAASRLKMILSDIKYTRQIWTEPIGIKSDLFLNQLISGTCGIGRNELHDIIKKIESDCGRTDDEKKMGRIRIDIDLLEYDGQREHQQDWEREYVKLLIREL